MQKKSQSQQQLRGCLGTSSLLAERVVIWQIDGWEKKVELSKLERQKESFRYGKVRYKEVEMSPSLSSSKAHDQSMRLSFVNHRPRQVPSTGFSILKLHKILHGGYASVLMEMCCQARDRRDTRREVRVGFCTTRLAWNDI